VSGQFHLLAALPPEKEPWYPLERGLGGSQSWSGRDGEEKNSQPLPALKPPIIQCYTTELSWLPVYTLLSFFLFKLSFVFPFQ